MKVAKIKNIRIECTPKFMHKKELAYTVGSKVILSYYPSANTMPWDPHSIRHGVIAGIYHRFDMENCYEDDFVYIRFTDDLSKETYTLHGKEYRYPSRWYVPAKIFCKSVFAAIFTDTDPSDLYECKYEIYTATVLIDCEGGYWYPGSRVSLEINGNPHYDVLIDSIDILSYKDTMNAVVHLTDISSESTASLTKGCSVRYTMSMNMTSARVPVRVNKKMQRNEVIIPNVKLYPKWKKK